MKIKLPSILWLVVSTHLKNISQIGNHPQVGAKINNIWNHHLDRLWPLVFNFQQQENGWTSNCPSILHSKFWLLFIPVLYSADNLLHNLLPPRDWAGPSWFTSLCWEWTNSPVPHPTLWTNQIMQRSFVIFSFVVKIPKTDSLPLQKGRGPHLGKNHLPTSNHQFSVAFTVSFREVFLSKEFLDSKQLFRLSPGGQRLARRGYICEDIRGCRKLDSDRPWQVPSTVEVSPWNWRRESDWKLIGWKMKFF